MSSTAAVYQSDAERVRNTVYTVCVVSAKTGQVWHERTVRGFNRMQFEYSQAREIYPAGAFEVSAWTNGQQRPSSGDPVKGEKATAAAAAKLQKSHTAERPSSSTRTRETGFYETATTRAALVIRQFMRAYACGFASRERDGKGRFLPGNSFRFYSQTVNSPSNTAKGKTRRFAARPVSIRVQKSQEARS